MAAHSTGSHKGFLLEYTMPETFKTNKSRKKNRHMFLGGSITVGIFARAEATARHPQAPTSIEE